MNIEILDCTLRDGGYVNQFNFNDTDMSHIIKQLHLASIDIVECGFLDQSVDKKSNSSRFFSIEILNNLLQSTILKNSLNVAMVERGKYDVQLLPNVNKKIKNEIKGIRYSFRKSDHCKIFDDIKVILSRGYKVFIQPIATQLYSDIEIINFIDRCNKYDITAFYIVDTHGSMLSNNLRRLYFLLDNNLKAGVKLGFHSHNNLQLSYSNAIDLVEISSKSERVTIIDGSIYGMGRGAGNLNTELLVDHLNRNYCTDYDIDCLLEVVDDYLLTIKQENEWGYSLEHFLSAIYNCHPSYASLLINKKNLSIVEIKKLLNLIPTEDRREFDIDTIETMYIEYKEKISLKIKDLPDIFYKKNILLLASGSSVLKHNEQLNEKINEYALQVISLNHINRHTKYSYSFFSNQMRYNSFSSDIEEDKLIVTSNIKVKPKHKNCFVLDFKVLFEYENLCVDNVAILALNLLTIHQVRNVFLAGLDGYKKSEGYDYSYGEYNKVVNNKVLIENNNLLIKSIQHISEKIHISYLTPSQFKKHTKQKVIGIIPSRYASVRLPGKPLKDIAGLPMIIHVLKRVLMSKVLDEVYVATDDIRIFNVVREYGGKAIMTSEKHNNGTERTYEVSTKIFGDIFVVINGDEALVKPEHIDMGVSGLISSDASVSLLYNDFYKVNSPSDFKVAITQSEHVMFISRSDIPSNYKEKVDNMYKAYHVMSFTSEFLETYYSLGQTPLDKVESHELLRVLENDYQIKAVKVNSTAISVDTQEDLDYVANRMKSDVLFLKYKDDVL